MHRFTLVALMSILVWSCGGTSARVDAGSGGGRTSTGGGTSAGGGTAGGTSAGGGTGGGTSAGGGMAGGTSVGGGTAGGESVGGGTSAGGGTAGGTAGGTSVGGGTAGGTSVGGGTAGGTSVGGGTAGGTSVGGGTAGGTSVGGGTAGGAGVGGGTASTDGGTGESCGDEADLLSASTATPGAGYQRRLIDSLGQVNNYSPFNGDAIPPSCSVVYPAPGRERVYRLTLQPNKRVEMRLSLVPFGTQPALYVFRDPANPNQCVPVIFDGDNTGGCGSNEYNVGFCGVATGCSDSTLTHTNSGATPVDVFVAVDQGGTVQTDGGLASYATQFTLDWRILP
jgi:hypothetical protein